MPEDPNIPLMKLIGSRFGAILPIAIDRSGVPESFLASLIGNESAGNPNARRFEKLHFGEILEVMAGQRPKFDPAGISRPLGIMDFQPFIDPDPAAGVSLRLPQSLLRAVWLATSVGVTQIMGWHFLEFDLAHWLPNPTIPQQLQMTVKLLAYFATRYSLILSSTNNANNAELFACWNCGQPTPGKTFDPNYCANGLARMKIYDELKKTAAPPPLPGEPEAPKESN
jgi:hypothetical protein